MLLISIETFSQYIVNTVYDDGGKHFIYNGNLLFQGNPSAAPNYAFSKYDGSTASSVLNATGNTNVYQDTPIEYNGSFYFKATGNILGKYDGTSITYIPKVSPTDIGINSQVVVYNSKLLYVYRGNANLRQMATFDGTTQVLYPNPDAATSAYTYVFPAYNGEQYFGYVNQNGNIALVKFNGTTTTLINNPNNTDWGVYSGNACVVNGVLIFLYQTSDAKVHFAKYDGTSITVMPNFSGTDDFIYSNLIAYNNAVYSRYKDSSGKFHLAKYDGTTVTVIPNFNATDTGYMDSPFVYNNKLYARYANSSANNLVRTDGTTLELLPTIKYLGGNGEPKGYALEVAGNMYLRVEAPASFTTLGKFDGTTLTTYGNVSNTNPSLGVNELAYFNNKIHFVANGKLSYLDQVILANDTFEKEDFKIYPNPSNGIININTTSENLGYNIEIHNLLGQTLITKKLNATSNQIDLSSYPRGAYLVKVYIDEKRNKVYKVIKQ